MMGGAEHHVVKLCRALDRRVIAPSLVLLRRGLPQELASLLPADVPVLVAPVGRRDPRLVPWLARQLRRQEIDVAQSFLWYADAIAAAAALLVPRLRLVCSERGDRSMAYHVATRRAYDRLVTFRRAGELTANSRFGASLLIGLGARPERVSVIANGVDVAAIASAEPAPLRDLLRWPGTAHVVASVSRHVEGKGLATLIRAVARTGSADLRVAMIGDGPLRPALEALARQLGVQERVAFLGQRSPAVPFLKACDSAVQLSEETEHCSNSIIEAMACGKPVVATAVGGNPELVTDGRTGILVPPGNPAAVAAALLRLSTDPAFAAQLGSRGQDAAGRRYSISAVAEEFTALWRSAAARR
jgi:glycosyltransferase involved in cell wall biosynthesis